MSFSRDPNAWLAPPLLFEDGRDIFGFYYERRDLAALLRPHAGYLVLVPNFFGWLALAVPTTAAPHLIALFPLLLASAAFAWLARREFRTLEADDRARALLACLLALFPIANDRFLGNTMYAVWSALLLLVFASLAPPPARAHLALARGLGMGILIASHALSAVLIPVYAALALAAPRLVEAAGAAGGGADPAARTARIRVARGFYAGLALLGIAYQLFGVDRGALAWVGPLELTQRTLALLCDRVAFAALFGDAAALWLRRVAGPAAVQLVGAALCALPALAAWRLRAKLTAQQGGALAVLAWVSLAVTAMCVLGRGASEELIRSGRADRFFWVQRACFLVLFAWGLRQALALRWPQLPRAALACVALWLAVQLAFVNRANQHSYRVRVEEGQRVAAFARELARQEQRLGGSRDVRARLERGRWSIAIGGAPHAEGRILEPDAPAGADPPGP